MRTGNWDCPLPKCTFSAESDLSNIQAMQAFVMHLKYIHGIPRNGDNSPIMLDNYNPKTKGYKVPEVGLTIRAMIEIELDKYIKTAMEWKQPEGGIWDSNELAKIRNELEKAKATAAGRGLAIALWILHGGDTPANKFRSPDHVIRDAIERYNNPVPEDSHMGVSSSDSNGQVKRAQSTSKLASTAKLTDEQRVKIKEALDSGFDAKQLSSMFKVSLAEIEGCR